MKEMSMKTRKLFMLLLGCKPEGRHTEQHDIFFGIGTELSDLVQEIQAFWPGNHSIHIDAWREINLVDGFAVVVQEKKSLPDAPTKDSWRLFFINLGGYKENEFEEFHYRMVLAARSKAEAIARAKATAFYRHTGFKGADSHIDDKYGIDVDDFYEVADLLPKRIKEQYQLLVHPSDATIADAWELGYTKLSSLVK
ncbi:MAG: hypothetical protein RLZZ28_1732 [Bacteroidota bacterium]|jgi:hypothetical protein